MVHAPLIVGGVALAGGLGFLAFSEKKAHAAVHPAALGTSPAVVGKPDGPVLVVNGLPDPPLVVKRPTDLGPAAGSVKIVPAVIGQTSGGNTLHVVGPNNPDTGKPTTAYNVAVNGKAVQQAHDLYDFLVKNGGAHTDGTDTLKNLVTAFQAMHNTDPQAVLLSTQHQLPVNGVYDQYTSGALTIYTGHAIPPNPATPPPPPMTAAEIKDPARTAPIQSPAAYSSFNLYTYLKLHGNDKSAALKPLVKAFQHDVNTDPTFPGPVSFSGVKIIKTPLVEDGLYGPGTYAALKVMTMDTPKP